MSDRDNVEQAPERIWLQWGDGSCMEFDGVTWCVDPQQDDDVQFVRADIALLEASEEVGMIQAAAFSAGYEAGEEAAKTALKAERDALREALTFYTIS